MAGFFPALSQIVSTPPNATVTGSVNAADAGSITIDAQLNGCQTLPFIAGGNPLIRTDWNVAPDVNGNFTLSLPGNDKIVCEKQSYSTYALTWQQNGTAMGPTRTYRFLSGQSCVLSDGQPNSCKAISFIPPIIAKGAGGYCPANSGVQQVLIGFNADYSPKCVSPSYVTGSLNLAPSGNQVVVTPPGSILQFVGETEVDTPVNSADAANKGYVDVLLQQFFTNLASVTGNFAVGGTLNAGNITAPSATITTETVTNSNITSGTFGNVTVASAITKNFNGTLYANDFMSGTDIFQGIQAAFNSCGGACHVVVRPGTYPTSTTAVVWPTPGAGLHGVLTLEAGATLNYSGTGCAITMPFQPVARNNRIDGMGQINGTSVGQCGIEIPFGNNSTIDGPTIFGFTNGSAILLYGAIEPHIHDTDLSGNKYGILVQEDPAHASTNGAHIHDNVIVQNQVGIRSWNAGGAQTPNENNIYSDNDFEQNTVNGLDLEYESGTQVNYNYFEGSPIPILLGNDYESQNHNLAIKGNHFTNFDNAHEDITLKGIWAQVKIDENVFYGTASKCTVNVVPTNPGGYYEQYTTYGASNSYQKLVGSDYGMNTSPAVCYNGAVGLPPSADGSSWPGSPPPVFGGYFLSIDSGATGPEADIFVGGGNGGRRIEWNSTWLTGFCTPSTTIGTELIVADGRVETCEADTVAPGGGAGGNAADGGGTWVAH